MIQDEKFKGRYHVEDGYAGGARPQYFTVYASDIQEDMTNEDIERFYEETAEDNFRENITPSVERTAEFVAWARAQLNARQAT